MFVFIEGQTVPDQEGAVSKVDEVDEPPPPGEASPPADWETADGDVDPLLTPDDPDAEEADDLVGETIIKPKKKPAQAEETKSKKEHVNVVFIGHVGK